MRWAARALDARPLPPNARFELDAQVCAGSYERDFLHSHHAFSDERVWILSDDVYESARTQ